MTILYEREFTLAVAFLVFLLSLLTWVVLWNKRSASTHLWCGAGIAGAANMIVHVYLGDAYRVPDLIEYPMLATFAVVSVSMKASALYGLLGGRIGYRSVTWPPLSVIAVAVLLALGGASRATLSAWVLFAMMACLSAIAFFAHRLAGEQRLLNARLLSITFAIPLVITVIAFFSALGKGVDLLLVGNRVISFQEAAIPVLLAVFNNGLFIGVVTDVASKRQTETDAALAAVSQERSRLEERARLVADLHDGFGSQLTIARLSAERGQLTQAEMLDVLEECLADLHLVVDSMHNVDGSVGSALRYMRNRLTGRLAGMPIQLHWELDVGDAAELAPARLLNLLRILQEAINNALRHAQARNVWVSATQEGQRVLLLVRDDGHGMPADVTEGAGLRNMRGRASKLGAKLAITSTSEGTRISVSVAL